MRWPRIGARRGRRPAPAGAARGGGCRAPCPGAGPRRGGPPEGRGEPGRGGRPAPRGSHRRRRPGPLPRSAAPRRMRQDHRTSPPDRPPGRPPGQALALDLADEGEHRRRVLTRRVDADREICGADCARADRRGGAARELAVGLGHERGGALVARGDDPDAGGVEALEQAEEALARDGECLPDADGAKRVRDEPTDGPRRCRQRLRSGLGGGGRVASARRRAALRASASTARWRTQIGRGLGHDRLAGSGSAASGSRVGSAGLRLGDPLTRLGLDGVDRSGRPAGAADSGASAASSVGSVVVSVTIPRPSRSSGGLRPAPSSSRRRRWRGDHREDESGNHHDGHDDHRHPRVARPWHHGPVTGSSRTGAAPPRPAP